MANITIGGKEFTSEQIQMMIEAGLLASAKDITALGQKHDPFNTTNNFQPPHGYWSDGTTPGLFSRPGVEPDVFSAIRYPEARLFQELWNGTTNIIDPVYEILTGVDGLIGETAADSCSQPPRPGLARLCTQIARFGHYHIGTGKIDVSMNGGYINRGDVDRRVVNTLEQSPLFPPVSGMMDVNRTFGLEMFKLGISNLREFGRVLFSGSIASSSGAFITEFNGFDQLIKTGHVDLDTGTFCNAADSLIVDYDNVNISGETQSNIVDIVSNIIYQLQARSEQNGAGGTWDGFIAMHPDLFFALTSAWPCSYLTNGCQTSGTIVINDTENVRMRDEMRNGRFLWILGQRIPVFATHAVAQTTEGAGFSSDIYFINTSMNGIRTTYLEGFDMGNPDNMQLISQLSMNELRLMSDNFWLSYHNRQAVCVEWGFIARPRLIMRTPWLSARLTNVNYNLPGYSNSPYPGDPYYVNGGNYVGTQIAPYTP